MITLKNPIVTDNWIVDLKTYSQVEGRLPLNGLNVRNDSNIVAWVDLDGLKVGEVQRYSADPFQGRNFDRIRIYNPDGQKFAADDLFIQATKGEVVSSQPFNPQWDMMFDDLDRFTTGTNSRMSLSDTTPLDTIKFWINSYNDLIVLRRLDIQAHATLLGAYKIIFSDADVLSGAVGIGVPPPPDTTHHKKTISDSAFDYTVTNCEIVGFVVDILSPTNLMNECTVTTDPGEPERAYNHDLTDHCTQFFSTDTAWLWGFQVDLLAEYSVSRCSFYANVNTGACTGTYNVEGWDGDSWIELCSFTHSGGLTYKQDIKTFTPISISKIRCGAKSSVIANSVIRIYSIEIYT